MSAKVAKQGEEIRIHDERRTEEVQFALALDFNVDRIPKFDVTVDFDDRALIPLHLDVEKGDAEVAELAARVIARRKLVA